MLLRLDWVYFKLSQHQVVGKGHQLRPKTYQHLKLHKELLIKQSFIR